MEEVAVKWVLCCLAVLAAIHGSTGLDLAPSALPADPPHAQQVPSGPAYLTNSQLPSPPSLSNPPGADEIASSPSQLTISPTSTSPTPSTLPKVSSPPTQASPPAPTKSQNTSAPSPLPLPKGSVVPPSVVASPALLPSVPSPAPADPAVQPQLPMKPPPSVHTQPSSPPLPGSNVPASAPKKSFAVTPPSASVPGQLPVIPPSTTPTTRSTSPPPLSPRALTPSNTGNAMPPQSTSPPVRHKKNNGAPPAPPPMETNKQIPPANNSPVIVSSPATSPVPHKAMAPPSDPAKAPSNTQIAVAPTPAPVNSSPAQRPSPKNGSAKMPFAPSHAPSIQGPEVSPSPKESGNSKPKHHEPPSFFPGPSEAPALSPSSSASSPVAPSGANEEPKAPAAHSTWTLPPPPPNLNCNTLVCPEPLTDPPLGAPCVCVLPIKVELRLSVALYAFFPLVSDFAQEVASGVAMSPRQVRVMGANVDSDASEKTVVFLNLVPFQVKFDSATAYSAFENFWSKKIPLESSLFGGYEVLYVVYPGLPPSPPSAASAADVDEGSLGGRNSRAMKPLGVDVRRAQRKVNGSLIAIVVLSTLTAVIVCTLAAWLLLLKWRDSADTPERFPHTLLSEFSRSPGGRHSSLLGSLSSSIASYAGQARTLKLAEVERATNYFDSSKVLGEGGFGCVYQGALEDGTRVAVKVLKKHDYQGEREFLSEIEMLGRLHHRNLVKLIGICMEGNARCLIYELIPNGSVESHLHGVHKKTASLDWNARVKIALGAARGLAYLHEDSNPRVIHRDFKSSNILLEYDYTPKVSDFGLARTAMGEGNQHITTRVMGTFGYVAPEYAMTGHLLVKSDVYSYGVVLLELLTGRKPVDMSRPPGQENLVSWARPLLANVVSLRKAVDPVLGANIPFDNVAKVAAIATMCVQPEVAHRPSMGEVVQALKLVCSEGDEGQGTGSFSFSQELAAQAATTSNEVGREAERVLLSDMFGSSPVFMGDDSGSFHRQSSSGPLVTGKMKFWQRLRSLSRGNMSEHGASSGFETRSETSDQ